MFVNFSGTQQSSDAARQDRLQKAILRNRAKQAKRQQQAVKQQSQSFGTKASTWSTPVNNPATYFPQVVTTAKKTEEKAKSFRLNVKLPRLKIPEVSFSLRGKITKGLGLFCLFLVYQLIFSDNGIWDYYKMEKLLKSKSAELVSTHAKIKSLRKEIKLLRYNKKHQKKVAKQKLGVLAEDEFIVLFAPGKD